MDIKDNFFLQISVYFSNDFKDIDYITTVLTCLDTNFRFFLKKR